MKITTIFILSFIVLAVAFDFFIIAYSGKQASISATVIRWSYEYPSFTFGAGFLCGHLFWKMKDSNIYVNKGK